MTKTDETGAAPPAQPSPIVRGKRGLERLAVVDVGSNSVRMVVFDGAARSPAYFYNEKIMAGLGQGLADTGHLNPRGRERALAALRRDHEALLACVANGTGAGPDQPLSARAIAVDLSLHDLLAEALDNPLLQDSYEANRTRVAIIQRTRPFLADRIASAMQEHLVILDALDSGDAVAAVAGIDHHFRQTLRWWGVSD